jgi:tight adherence protein B
MMIVAFAVAAAVGILGFAAAHYLAAIARRYEEDYVARAGKALDAIQADVAPRAIWQASLATAALGLVVGLAIARSVPVATVLAAVGAIVPLGYLRVVDAQRRRAFHEQLPDVISQTRTAVSCGYTLPMALAIAQREMPAPASQELRLLQGHLRLGVPFGEACVRLQKRMPNDDVDLFVGALTMAERAGGSLGAVLTNIEQSVRERLRLEKKLKTMTSRGRMEAWIISLLPFGLGAGMYYLNPPLMSAFLGHPVGQALCVGATVWMVIGFLVIKKILTPDF